MPLYIAFIDLSKAVDFLSRKGQFRLLIKFVCAPELLTINPSFHKNMQCVVSYGRQNSVPFAIQSGVKQGWVLEPTLFGIFFSMLLSFQFRGFEECVNLHIRSNGKLFNLAQLRAKTKMSTVFIREVLSADDASLATHTEHDLQQLSTQFNHAYEEFGMTIKIKKTPKKQTSWIKMLLHLHRSASMTWCSSAG